MNTNDKTLDVAEDVQKELQGYITVVKEKNPKIEYQDLVTAFFCVKIAELQEEIKRLKYTKQNAVLF